MKVDVRVRELPGMPEPNGPHALSWSYLLDAVFADAYHRRLASLRVLVPAAALAAEVEERADVTPPRPDTVGAGVAWLTGAPDAAEGADDGPEARYLLTFGRLAPRVLRSSNGVPDPSMKDRLSVYTWRARLLGLSIRLAAMRRRPEAQDRALAAMRRAFACAGDAPAYYHLHLPARSPSGGRT